MKQSKGESVCEVCNKKLRSRYHLKIHMTVHTGEKNYKCDICGRGYQQKWNLVTHVARVHSKEKPFKCSDCGKAFGYSSHFKRHVKTHFLEKIKAPDLIKRRILNPFKCKFCDKSFESNYRLELHTRTHTGTKPYVCDKCGKSFTNKRLCAAHVQKKHLNAKTVQRFAEEPTPDPHSCNGIEKIVAEKEKCQQPLKKELILCEVCGKSISRGSVKKHLNIHYQNRIYSCCYCKKIFLESGQRIVHERKHTGEKPYTCEICGQGHTQYGNLLTHRKRYHSLVGKNKSLWKRNNQGWKQTSQNEEKASESIESNTSSDSAPKYTGNETIQEFLKKASSWANKKFQESKNIFFESKNESNGFTYSNDDNTSEIEDSSIEIDNALETKETKEDVNEENKNITFLEFKKKINRKIYEKLVEDLKMSSISDNVLQVVKKIENSQKQGLDVLREFLKGVKNVPDNTIMREHEGQLFWHCWICHSKLKSRHLLARHLITHEPEENRPFRCKICFKTFTQSNNFKEHIMSHSNENQFYCDKCGSGFRHKSHFNSHIKRHDATAKELLKKFECSFCSKKMRTNYQKMEHERTHTKEKPFLCKVCGQQFSASSTLSRHQSTHMDPSHQCTICFKFFRQKSNLKRHFDTHSQYPYSRFSCDCGKTFSQSPSLKKHKMICKNRVEPIPKPFSCPICSKRFLTKSDLKRHVATHDSEKKFKCSVCSTMLKSIETFRIHLRRHNDI